MGDMADYTLEQVEVQEERAFQYLTGNMDIIEAIDCGVCDEQGHLHQILPVKKICRYCHKTDLTWRKTDAGWRLANPDGTIHTCPQYRPTESQSMDEE